MLNAHELLAHAETLTDSVQLVDRILRAELRRGIQAASCVGPGKSNLPFELRRKAGDCSREIGRAHV